MPIRDPSSSISTDPLFRPVNIKTGPDGALYIVDMYHGIIQDANWTARGTYLRYKIQQYQLDKVINHGRIWRLKFDGVPAGTAEAGPGQPAVPAIPFSTTWPSMSTQTPAQLAAHLSNPIGWWRDTAQKLLVLKQDKSVVPQLREIARTSDSLVGRFHAMWTLEGLGALDATLVREQMKDPNPRMRIQALRASESLFKAGDRTLDADYRAMAKDSDTDVVHSGAPDAERGARRRTWRRSSRARSPRRVRVVSRRSATSFSRPRPSSLVVRR